MSYREHRIPTSLQRHVGMSSLTDVELRAMAERAWRERGVVVLFPDQNLPPMSRALIESEAKRLYGEKRRQ